MSRYIDEEKLLDKFCGDCDCEECEWNLCGDCTENITFRAVKNRIKKVEAADVVSREQYNKLYEEKLELEKINENLRCTNEHLMDVLRELGEY